MTVLFVCTELAKMLPLADHIFKNLWRKLKKHTNLFLPQYNFVDIPTSLHHI